MTHSKDFQRFKCKKKYFFYFPPLRFSTICIYKSARLTLICSQRIHHWHNWLSAHQHFASLSPNATACALLILLKYFPLGFNTIPDELAHRLTDWKVRTCLSLQMQHFAAFIHTQALLLSVRLKVCFAFSVFARVQLIASTRIECIISSLFV